MAGFTADPILPATRGVFQPKRDPALPSGPGRVGSSYDGHLGVLDLSSFRGANFYLEPRYAALTWRLGQPLPAEVSIPLTLVGDLGHLPVTASNSERFKAEYSDSPTPSIRVSVEQSHAASGVFSESLKIEWRDSRRPVPQDTVVTHPPA